MEKSTLAHTVGVSDLKFEWGPVGLTIYTPLLTIGGRPAKNETRVAGILLCRYGEHSKILTVACSGGPKQQALDGNDEMVDNDDHFKVVKNIARQLRLNMNHPYDTSAGTKTIEESGEH